MMIEMVVGLIILKYRIMSFLLFKGGLCVF